MGNYDEGIRLQREALQETNVFEHYLGISYESAGMRDSALAVAERLEGYTEQWFNFGLAELWAVLGDEEKAMQYVEKAFEQRQDFVVWFDRDYFMKSLWKNPRFIEIHNSFILP